MSSRRDSTKLSEKGGVGNGENSGREPKPFLSKEDEQKCDQAFFAFDKDGSDDIDIDEMRIVLKMMGIRFSESQLARMMVEANPQNPNKITKRQFKDVIAK